MKKKYKQMDELSGKQRRFLRAMGNEIKPKVYVGKAGICEPLVQSLNNSFNNKELVKIRIEKSCTMEKKEVAKQLATVAIAHLVQILGNTILLYRPNSENPNIDFPQ